MGKQFVPPKLTAKHKLKVLSLIAQGYSSARIVEYLEDNYDVKVSKANINHHYLNGRKYQNRINRIRQIIDKGLAAHPLASKVNRLNIILEALNEALKWNVDKLYFDHDTGELLGRVDKKILGVIAALIREAREELGPVADSDPKKATMESLMVELIKKSNGNGNGDGREIITITKTRRDILDKFLAR